MRGKDLPILNPSGSSTPGPRQSRVIRVIKIPLNLPLLKGDFNYPTLVIFFLSLDRQRGGEGDQEATRNLKYPDALPEWGHLDIMPL